MGIPKLLENIKAESQFGVRSCVLQKVFEHRKSKLETSIHNIIKNTDYYFKNS